MTISFSGPNCLLSKPRLKAVLVVVKAEAVEASHQIETL
jgi:hypothetical protein